MTFCVVYPVFPVHLLSLSDPVVPEQDADPGEVEGRPIVSVSTMSQTPWQLNNWIVKHDISKNRADQTETRQGEVVFSVS